MTCYAKNNMLERFWKKVDIKGDNECWTWKGATNGSYGLFRGVSGMEMAHSISWTLCNRREPFSCVLHICDNPLCVNPRHLFEGSAHMNAVDRSMKGRGGLGQKSRFYVGEAFLMRKLVSSKRFPLSMIAKIFKTSPQNIFQISKGQHYRFRDGDLHLTGVSDAKSICSK